MTDDDQIDAEFRLEIVEGPTETARRDDYAIHPQVADLAERVVAAYRELNRRLLWIDDPEVLDAFIRNIAVFQLGWTRREYPAKWRINGLENAAISLQDELMEELAEPWPLRSLDHPPGQRVPAGPIVTLGDGVARIRYGSFEVGPIALS